MKASITLLLSLLFTYTLAKKVIELTDANFEHDTQASTGATTGDWFVAFTDGRNSPQEISPDFDQIWGELAGKLYRRVSIAHVDM